MAVVVTTLTQSERDLAADDKPIIAATPNTDTFIDSASGWVRGTITGTSAAAVDTDTDKPIRRAVDGLPGLRTVGNSSNALWSIILNFASPGITFDFLGILSHNWRTINVTAATLQVADDSAFTVNLRTLGTRNVGANASDRRWADLTLIDTGGDAQRFAQVEWIRIGLTLGGAAVPEVGQIVFGRRRQLKHAPNRPFDITDLQTNSDTFESRAGVQTDTPRLIGRRRLVANLNPFNEPFQQDLIDWHTDLNQGISPFVWIDTPDATPDDFWFMKKQQPSFEYPQVLFSTREHTVLGNEQGPTFFTQDP